MLLSAQNNLGLSTSAPTARLDVNGKVRIRNIPITTADTYLLTADADGNVNRRLVSSIGGNSSLVCLGSLSTVNFVPRVNSSGNFTCSQIYDNGTNVGIGTTSPGNKLTVNGNIQSLSNTFLSDRKFKKNIKTIDNALESILKLTGNTYNWRQDEFSELEFNDKTQYGLIAQEVEKIIPELVNI